MCFSAFLKRRSLSMGVSILFYFLLTIIWSFISGIVLITANPSLFNVNHTNPQMIELFYPDSYFAINMVNPVTGYSGIIELNLGSSGPGSPSSYPSFFTTGPLILVLFIWIIVPLVLAYIKFERKDI